MTKSTVTKTAPAPTVRNVLRVRPRPGIILAGVPAAGAEVDADQAREWIRNGLVIEDQRAEGR
jgi:hypothetical protein